MMLSEKTLAIAFGRGLGAVEAVAMHPRPKDHVAGVAH